LIGFEHLVAIERKSLSDLLTSIGQQRERFEREIQRLLAYPVRALVVEATWAELEAGEWTTSQITASAAMGSCLGWVARGLPVLMATDHRGAGRCVSRLLWITARRRWRENQDLIKAVLDSPAKADPATLCTN
jgi:ERCC4-type nuclease